MKVRDLAGIEHPDFNDVLIHFTGRAGVDRADVRVRDNDDWGRLRSIVEMQLLLGFELPGTGASAVCFTEATAEGCSWLIRARRYTSCGIAFSKRYLFSKGGGPVLQVRGDEWASVASWPDELRARAVRLWPGATPERGEQLPWWLEGRSEWLYEREWRVATPGGQLEFDPAEIAFLVLPSEEHLRTWVAQIHRTTPDLASQLASARYVVIDSAGVDKANGVSVKRSAGSVSVDGS